MITFEVHIDIRIGARKNVRSSILVMRVNVLVRSSGAVLLREPKRDAKCPTRIIIEVGNCDVVTGGIFEVGSCAVYGDTRQDACESQRQNAVKC